MAEKDIVIFEENTLLLASGLSAEAFGKIKTQKEPGTLAHLAVDGSVTFEDWFFDGTQRRQSERAPDEVFYSGSFSGSSLYAALNEGGASARKAAASVCAVLEKAILEKRPLAPVGAGGILLQEDSASGACTVLFLPAEHFERAASNHGENCYAALQGAYVNRSLNQEAALAFSCAAFAYRAFSGTNAYPATDSSIRSSDMYDGNFTPLSLLLTGLNEGLMQAIHEGLRMRADLRILPGEKRTLAKEQAAIQSQRENAMKSLVQAGIVQALLQADVGGDSPDLKEKRARWQHDQAIKIKRKRFIRRNRSSLITAACAVLAASWIVISFTKENQSRATSRGLSSRETVETLYTAIHRSDVTVLKEVSSGLNNMMTVLSGFYVTNKQRFAMDQQNVTLSPAEWLFFSQSSNFWQYGLTQLLIDGSAGDSTFDYPCRKDKPQPLTMENGIVLQKGAAAHHQVTYNLIHTDSSEQLFVEHCSDAVTLIWKGKRWIVTQVESSSEQEAVRLKSLRKDFAAALEAADGDLAKAVSALRSSYSWLPTDAELKDAARKMADEYNNSTAKALLGELPPQAAAEKSPL